jgi:hypothetical protein
VRSPQGYAGKNRREPLVDVDLEARYWQAMERAAWKAGASIASVRRIQGWRREAQTQLEAHRISLRDPDQTRACGCESGHASLCRGRV